MTKTARLMMAQSVQDWWAAQASPQTHHIGLAAPVGLALGRRSGACGKQQGSGAQGGGFEGNHGDVWVWCGLALRQILCLLFVDAFVPLEQVK